MSPSKRERGQQVPLCQAQCPGQCPGLGKGTSALPALCKGSQETRTPSKAVAADQVGVGRSSQHISAGPVDCRQSPLHVLRVVLETCDEVSDRFSLVADPIHSSEEGEPVGRQRKSPEMAESEHLDFCHGMQEQVGQWHCGPSNRPFVPSWCDVGSAETPWGFPLLLLLKRSQPHPNKADRDSSTHFSTTFLLLRIRCSSADVWGPCSFCPFSISFSSCSMD